jgi:hypothetical protein
MLELELALWRLRMKEKCLPEEATHSVRKSRQMTQA